MSAAEPDLRAVAGARAPFREHGARGERFGELPEALRARLPEWIATGSAAGCEPLKAGSVFRLGGLVAKFFPPKRGWRRLGRSKARVSAALHAALAPIATPRPLLAVDGVGPDRRGALLVYEYVEGRSLEELWGRDPRALEALVELLARLDERRIVHGDLHPGNLVWNGEAWTLLDLAGLRHGLHGLFLGRAQRRTWVRLLESLGDEEGVRGLHSAWARRRGLQPQARWRRIVASHVPARAERARGRRRERERSAL
jgi:hypothetical protein